MTDSNNSTNNPPDPAIVVNVSPNVAIPGATGQVLTVNGSGGTQWITVPVTATGSNGAGNCAGTWIPGQTFTITVGGGGGGGGGNGQLSFNDIDLAVPVAEKKEKSDGCSCKKCKEYYQYAEPNQDDGTLICYGCRIGW